MRELSEETRRVLRRLDAAPGEPPPEEDLVAAIGELNAALQSRMLDEAETVGGEDGPRLDFRLGSPRVVFPVAPPYPVEEALLPEGAIPPPARGPDGYDPATVMDWAAAELHRRFAEKYGGRKRDEGE